MPRTEIRGPNDPWHETIPIDSITAPPSFVNVRGANDGDLLGDLTELRTSIEAEGVRVPPEILRPMPGVNWLVDGFRRTACLRELARENRAFGSVLCLVRPYKVPGDLAGAQAELTLLNLTSDTGRTPVPAWFVARRTAAVVAAGMATVGELIARTGKGQTTIRRYCQVIDALCPEALAAGDAGQLTFLQAIQIAEQTHDRQRAMLEAGTKEQQKAEAEGKDATHAFSAAARKVSGAPPRAAKHVAPLKLIRTGQEGSSPVTEATAPTGTTPATPEKPREPSLLTLRTNLATLGEYLRRLRATDEVDLLPSLEVDTSELSPEAAALYGVIEGLKYAFNFVAETRCSTCGAVVVALAPDGRTMPVTHECGVRR